MEQPRENPFGRRRPQPMFTGLEGIEALFEAWLDYRRIISINPELFPHEEPFTDIATTLLVKKLDLDVKNNTVAHHTDVYSVTNAETYKLETGKNEHREDLVVRRGQPFDICVEFNKAFNPEKDNVKVVLQCGNNPLPAKETHIELIPSSKPLNKEWGAIIQSNEGNKLRLSLMTSATCAVGKWALMVDYEEKNGDQVDVKRFKHTSPVYILFNPWCIDDPVHMSDESQRTEYILNETGKIYVGSAFSFTGKPWSFGQFEGDVFDCVIYLLEKSGLPPHVRGNPVLVARKMSKMVNVQDEGGVLVGNWSGEYGDGTSPLEWNGSPAILEQFLKSKESVRYGQCWVFSGVLTTVCRSLGIPARSVTNFASAHDTDKTITIDVYLNKEGEHVEYLNNDSVWNFHVWNDVWMARPDLPAGYGGWQAIDATPQETSEGVFQTGPASLAAIKRGEVYMQHDTAFIFSEVNGDRVYHKRGHDGKFVVARIDKRDIGKNISAKRATGEASWRETWVCRDREREDITNQYKYPEGSEEERVAVHKANLHFGKAKLYEAKHEDVTFELVSDNVFMGETVKVGIKMKNTSSSKRTVNGSLILKSTFYTGVPYKLIKKHQIDNTILEANQEKTVDVEVGPALYLDKLTDHCLLLLSCMCLVDETQQTFTAVEDRRLRKPHLDIKAPNKARVGEKFEVEVSFDNKLTVPLTSCELRVDGPGLKKTAVYKNLTDVGVDQTFTMKFEMTPIKVGKREIIVNFNCKQISSVNVSHVIDIVE